MGAILAALAQGAQEVVQKGQPVVQPQRPASQPVMQPQQTVVQQKAPVQQTAVQPQQPVVQQPAPVKAPVVVEDVTDIIASAEDYVNEAADMVEECADLLAQAKKKAAKYPNDKAAASAITYGDRAMDKVNEAFAKIEEYADIDFEASVADAKKQLTKVEKEFETLSTNAAAVKSYVEKVNTAIDKADGQVKDALDNCGKLLVQMLTDVLPK